jgi:hypothetical protein
MDILRRYEREDANHKMAAVAAIEGEEATNKTKFYSKLGDLGLRAYSRQEIREVQQGLLRRVVGFLTRKNNAGTVKKQRCVIDVSKVNPYIGIDYEFMFEINEHVCVCTMYVCI